MGTVKGYSTHRCTCCNQRKAAEEFFRKGEGGWRDTTGTRRESTCKDCRAVLRNKSGRRRETVPSGSVRRLDPAPFKAWLELKLKLYGNAAQVGFATGLCERRIRAVLADEQDRVSIETVDQALTHEGSTFLFELYPDLYPGLDTAPVSEALRAADVGTPTDLSYEERVLA